MNAEIYLKLAPWELDIRTIELPVRTKKFRAKLAYFDLSFKVRSQ